MCGVWETKCGEEESPLGMGGMGSREWLARLDDWRCYQASGVGDSDEKAGRDPECHTGGRGVIALHISCCVRVGGVTGRVQLPSTNSGRYVAAEMCRPGTCCAVELFIRLSAGLPCLATCLYRLSSLYSDDYRN